MTAQHTPWGVTVSPAASLPGLDDERAMHEAQPDTFASTIADTQLARERVRVAAQLAKAIDALSQLPAHGIDNAACISLRLHVTDDQLALYGVAERVEFEGRYWHAVERTIGNVNVCVSGPHRGVEVES